MGAPQKITAIHVVVCAACCAYVRALQKVGLINVDFADVCTITRNGGRSLMGRGFSSGPDRCVA